MKKEGPPFPSEKAFVLFHPKRRKTKLSSALTCASSKEAYAIANARAWHLRRAGATRHTLDQPASPLRLERLCSGASMHMDVSLACTSLCLCVETVIRAQHSHPSVIYEHKLKITIDASCTPALTSCTRVGRVRACVCACACTCLGVRVCVRTPALRGVSLANSSQRAQKAECMEGERKGSGWFARRAWRQSACRARGV